MVHYNYIVLGAGPSGLTLANALRDAGTASILVLEKESQPGGLCRSTIVDGSPLDIGGGHFLDTVRTEANQFLFRFMPRDEWQEFQRRSTIRIYGRNIGYPLESHLWQLDPAATADILESIAKAGCIQGRPMPTQFEDWISWKLGERIARDYMLPYNRKIWSVDLNTLGTYWLYKLPSVSFRDTILSCLTRTLEGSVPAHSTFLYPKRYGYGEVWRRLGSALGSMLALNYEIRWIDQEAKTINGELRYDYLINTVPWPCWLSFASLPANVAGAVKRLVYSSIDVHYSSEAPPESAHWVYIPDEALPYHRLLCRANFACGSRGHWTETNSKRTRPEQGQGFHNEFAYPLNTIDKRLQVEIVSEWARSHNIVPLGRWGHWEHMNSDVAVTAALEAARMLSA